jgi:hypothetical protein
MWTSGEGLLLGSEIWSFRYGYLTAWLKNIGLPEYAHKFAQKDYHYLEDLLDMTMEEKDDIIEETGMLLEKKLTFNAMLKRLAVGVIRGGYLAGRELHHYPNGRNPIGRPLQVGDIVQLSAWVLAELSDIEEDESVKYVLTRGVLTKAVTGTITAIDGERVLVVRNQVQVLNLYERFEVVNNEVGNNEHWWYEKDVLEKRVRLGLKPSTVRSIVALLQGQLWRGEHTPLPLHLVRHMVLPGPVSRWRRRYGQRLRPG